MSYLCFLFINYPVSYSSIATPIIDKLRTCFNMALAIELEVKS